MPRYHVHFMSVRQGKGLSKGSPQNPENNVR